MRPLRNPITSRLIERFHRESFRLNQRDATQTKKKQNFSSLLRFFSFFFLTKMVPADDDAIFIARPRFDKAAAGSFVESFDEVFHVDDDALHQGPVRVGGRLG